MAPHRTRHPGAGKAKACSHQGPNRTGTTYWLTGEGRRAPGSVALTLCGTGMPDQFRPECHPLVLRGAVPAAELAKQYHAAMTTLSTLLATQTPTRAPPGMGIGTEAYPRA